jgi:hypothetical protein
MAEAFLCRPQIAFNKVLIIISIKQIGMSIQ